MLCAGLSSRDRHRVEPRANGVLEDHRLGARRRQIPSIPATIKAGRANACEIFCVFILSLLKQVGSGPRPGRIPQFFSSPGKRETTAAR